MTDKDKVFMREAIAMAKKGMNSNAGGPFGAVVVKDGKVVGRGHNMVLRTNDPTAHAEVVAIRDACKNLGDFQLEGCVIYTSCEPCPMCMGAIYWARPSKVYYACTKNDAADIGFDDDFIYKELDVPLSRRKIPSFPLLRDEALPLFRGWTEKEDKTLY